MSHYHHHLLLVAFADVVVNLAFLWHALHNGIELLTPRASHHIINHIIVSFSTLAPNLVLK